jgi:hypothetical protein
MKGDQYYGLILWIRVQDHTGENCKRIPENENIVLEA